jgi:hypothetical protein
MRALSGYAFCWRSLRARVGVVFRNVLWCSVHCRGFFLTSLHLPWRPILGVDGWRHELACLDWRLTPSGMTRSGMCSSGAFLWNGLVHQDCLYNAKKNHMMTDGVAPCHEPNDISSFGYTRIGWFRITGRYKPNTLEVVDRTSIPSQYMSIGIESVDHRARRSCMHMHATMRCLVRTQNFKRKRIWRVALSSFS